MGTVADWSSAVQWATYGVFAAGSLVLGVVDGRTRRLPSKVIYPLYATGLAGLAAAAALQHRFGALAVAAAAMVLVAGLFAAVWWVSPESLGFGDVRLAGLLGLYLGWLGVPAVYAGLLAGSFAAAAAALVIILSSRARGRSWRGRRTLPYGPFLLLGTWLAIVWQWRS